MAAERAELDSVLASETFQRSPKLSRLLSYICERYFRGEEASVTEFSIALDVLERGSGFDPQVDSVVRVDTHHLRKRLRQFYETVGRYHELQIQIPSGRYAPVFVAGPAVAEEPAAEILVAAPAAATAFAAPRHKLPRWLAAMVVVLVGIGFFAVDTVRARHASVTSVKQLPSVGDEGAVRILAGERNGDYVDLAGRAWLSDRYFTGGKTFHRPHPILRTQDPEIFQSGREGQFVYEIPLQPGVYQLQLYFAETGFAGESMRGVSLAINGIPQASLDVASDAGGADTATIKVFKDISPAKDGILHLTFQSTGPSFVNAIEVLPGIPGRMRPLRITARDAAFRDNAGNLWLPDLGFSGGRRSSRDSRVAGTPDPNLYLVQRFGHFNYSIPVVEGERYTLKLYFAETWFGTPNSDGGVGSRVFDVYCNGSTLLKAFDILRASGGTGGRAVIETFHNLEASPQGKLDISFVPVANYALLTALEVEQE